MARTKSQKKLAITRNGNKFTATWTNGEKYSAQWYGQFINDSNDKGKEKDKWTGGADHYDKIAAGSTSKGMAVLNWNNYKPFGSKYLYSLRFHLKADTEKGTVSSPVECVWSVLPPNKPSLSIETINSNTVAVSWSVNTSASMRNIFSRVVIQKKEGSGNWTNWQTVNAATGTRQFVSLATSQTVQFRAYSQGPRGNSSVTVNNKTTTAFSNIVKHFFGSPPAAEVTGAKVNDTTSAYDITASFKINASGLTVDEGSMKPQYTYSIPTATMACPNSASWSDGNDGMSARSGDNSYTTKISTTGQLDYDECLFVQILTEHDGVETPSNQFLAKIGELAAPVSPVVTMGAVTTSGFTVTVSFSDAGTVVPGAVTRVWLVRESDPTPIQLGDIPAGTTSADLTGNQDLTSGKYSIRVANVKEYNGITMQSSEFVYNSTAMPTSPTNLSVHTAGNGKVLLDWTNQWTAGRAVEISWANDPDAWMSTSEPSSYIIGHSAESWYVSNLETGRTWYFRVRQLSDNSGDAVGTPWSDMATLDLSSAPTTPALYPQQSVIQEDGIVTLYWSYVSTDGTSQMRADIVEATPDGNGGWTYSDTSVATVGDAQHVDISAHEQGWLDGTTHYLALRVKSASGRDSDGYSYPATVDVAPKPSISISGISSGMSTSWEQVDRFSGDGVSQTYTLTHVANESPTVEIDGEPTSSFIWYGDSLMFSPIPEDESEIVATYNTTGRVLNSLPITAVLTTQSPNISLAIERSEPLSTERPDGTISFGPEGETVALSDSNTIEYGDLTGYLDDGGHYRLVASTTDEYGQKAQDTLEFEVRWSHQAWVPTANVTVDGLVVKIETLQSEEYEAGDVVDIYRLSADEPELIVSGGVFGETYVDPYPAFGVFGGHRIVCRTANGDYTTGDEIAETDYTYLDGDLVECGDTVVEFDGMSIHLPYDLSMNHSWSKDFKRTKYLGGSIEGDWNIGVERNMTIGTNLVKSLDDSDIYSMRALASHAGVCHVRTPDGCSFDADIQVSESLSSNDARASFNLTIKRVDTRRAYGMTLSDWEAQ